MSPATVIMLASRDASGAHVEHRFADGNVIHHFDDDIPLDPLFVEDRVINPALMRRDMYGPGRTMGEMSVSSGAIVLANADGHLDYLLNYAFDGFRFTATAAGAIYRSGFIEQPTFDETEVVFHVRDVQHAFDVQLLRSEYAGTNSLSSGVEGTAADIKGQPKLLLIGTCRNVPPVPVNTDLQIYQFDGVRGFVTGYTISMYDKRSALTRGADYTSQAHMEANAPTAGQYRVYPAGGMIRTNAAHTLLTGDVFNPHAVGGTDDIDDVLYAILELSPVVTPNHYGPYLSANPGCGIYVQDKRTRLQVINELGKSTQIFSPPVSPQLSGMGSRDRMCGAAS